MKFKIVRATLQNLEKWYEGLLKCQLAYLHKEYIR